MTELLRIEESRYERLEQIAWWDQARLRRARVLVAGAGALGNEILKHLALVGVGRIVVVDFDRIELSNLSRSIFFRAADAGAAKAEVIAERLREVNPDVLVLPMVGDLLHDLGLGLLRRMDVVIAGLDSLGSRRGLNRMCWQVGVPWIDGAVDELNGILRVYVPPDGACFECGLSEDDYRHLGARHSCQLVPQELAAAASVPTSPTSASVVAAWQVQEALKHLHGRPLAASRGVSCYGANYEFWKPLYSRRPGCPAHEAFARIEELAEASCRSTVGELLRLLAARWGEGVEVELDREVVLAIRCTRCGKPRSCLRPLSRVRFRDSLCPRCGGEGDPILTHRLDGGPNLADLADLPLAALGIPPLHVLTARRPTGATWHFELTGDAAAEPLASFLPHEDTDGNP
jgi:molybdopterin/thiamine biosynthesis adenylyltransferase